MKTMDQKLHPAAWITLIAFILQQVTPAFAGPVNLTLRTESAQNRTIPGIEIPEEMGRLEEVTVPQGGPLLIHIQTAHGNYEAQKNIQALIQHLTASYDIHTLLLEGGKGKLHPEVLRLFPQDPSLNLKIADTLTQQAELTGAETFLLDSLQQKKSIEGYGLENAEAYRKNRKEFQEVLRAKEKSDSFLSEMDLQIGRLTAPHLNSSLKNFLKQFENFETGKRDLMTWVNFLKDSADRNLDIRMDDPFFQKDWPMLVRLARLQKIESSINLSDVKKQKEKFLKELRSLKISKTVIKQLDVLIDPAGDKVDSIQNLPSAQLVQALKDLMQELPEDFSFEPYQQLKFYIQLVVFRSELKSSLLFEEMEHLEMLLGNKLAQTETEKKLLSLFRDYRLLQKLFALELTQKEYQKIVGARFTAPLGAMNGAPTLKPSSFLPRFLELNTDKRVRDSKFSHLKEIDKLFDLALSFYQGAKERDVLMSENALQILKEKQIDRAILVTGGFHSEGMKQYFSEKGFSYFLVSPKIKEASDPQAYHRAMLEENKGIAVSQIEKILKVQLPETMAELSGEARYAQSVSHLLMGVLRDEKVSREKLEQADSIFIPFRSEVRPNQMDSGTLQSSANQPRAEVRAIENDINARIIRPLLKDKNLEPGMEPYVRELLSLKKEFSLEGPHVAAITIGQDGKPTDLQLNPVLFKAFLKGMKGNAPLVNFVRAILVKEAGVLRISRENPAFNKVFVEALRRIFQYQKNLAEPSKVQISEDSDIYRLFRHYAAAWVHMEYASLQHQAVYMQAKGLVTEKVFRDLASAEYHDTILQQYFRGKIGYDKFLLAPEKDKKLRYLAGYYQAFDTLVPVRQLILKVLAALEVNRDEQEKAKGALPAQFSLPELTKEFGERTEKFMDFLTHPDFYAAPLEKLPIVARSEVRGGKNKARLGIEELERRDMPSSTSLIQEPLLVNPHSATFAGKVQIIQPSESVMASTAEPSLLEGLTRAESNPNFAFQVAGNPNSANLQDLKLMNLVTGDTQVLATNSILSNGDHVFDVRSVSPDGQFVAFRFGGNPAVQATQVQIQRIDDPSRKLVLTFHLKAIEWTETSVILVNFDGRRKEVDLSPLTTENQSNPNFSFEVIGSATSANLQELRLTDLRTGQTQLLATNSILSNGDHVFDVKSVSPDGQFVAFRFGGNPAVQATQVQIQRIDDPSRKLVLTFHLKAIEWTETSVILVNFDGRRKEVDLSTIAVPSGWTRADSNPNFAFQIRPDATQLNLRLYLIDLRNPTQEILVGGGSRARHSPELFDVSSDGKLIVSSYHEFGPVVGNLSEVLIHKIEDLTAGNRQPAQRIGEAVAGSIKFQGDHIVIEAIVRGPRYHQNQQTIDKVFFVNRTTLEVTTGPETKPLLERNPSLSSQITGGYQRTLVITNSENNSVFRYRFGAAIEKVQVFASFTLVDLANGKIKLIANDFSRPAYQGRLLTFEGKNVASLAVTSEGLLEMKVVKPSLSKRFTPSSLAQFEKQGFLKTLRIDVERLLPHAMASNPNFSYVLTTELLNKLEGDPVYLYYDILDQRGARILYDLATTGLIYQGNVLASAPDVSPDGKFLVGGPAGIEINDNISLNAFDLTRDYFAVFIGRIKLNSPESVRDVRFSPNSSTQIQVTYLSGKVEIRTLSEVSRSGRDLNPTGTAESARDRGTPLGPDGLRSEVRAEMRLARDVMDGIVAASAHLPRILQTLFKMRLEEQAAKELPGIIETLAGRGRVSMAPSYKDVLRQHAVAKAGAVSEEGRAVLSAKWTKTLMMHPRALFLMLDAVNDMKAVVTLTLPQGMTEEKAMKNIAAALQHKNEKLFTLGEKQTIKELVAKLGDLIEWIKPEEGKSTADSLNAYIAQHQNGVATLMDEIDLISGIQTEANFVLDPEKSAKDAEAVAFMVPGLIRIASQIRGLSIAQQAEVINRMLKDVVPGASWDSKARAFIVEFGQFIESLIRNNQYLEVSA